MKKTIETKGECKDCLSAFYCTYSPDGKRCSAFKAADKKAGSVREVR